MYRAIVLYLKERYDIYLENFEIYPDNCNFLGTPYFYKFYKDKFGFTLEYRSGSSSVVCYRHLTCMRW